MGPDGNPTFRIVLNTFSYLGGGFQLGSAEIYSIFILFDILKKNVLKNNATVSGCVCYYALKLYFLA